MQGFLKGDQLRQRGGRVVGAVGAQPARQVVGQPRAGAGGGRQGGFLWG